MSPNSAGQAKKMGFTDVRVMLAGVPAWKKAGMEVTASEKLVQSGNIVLVDLRSKAEYEAGHIPRAHSIPLDSLASREDDMPLKAPIVLYANTAEEAKKGYGMIRKWGAKTGSVWPGGVAAWTGKGNKTASGATPASISWVRELGKGEVGVAEFKKAMEGGGNQVILDVRGKDEVQTGTFPNSLAIPLDELEKRIAELPRDKELLIHCTTGARAEMAKAALDKTGIKSRFLVADVECEQGKCVAVD